MNAVCYSEHSHSLINSDPYRRQYIYTKYTKTVNHQVVPGVSLSSQCWHIVTIYQKKKKKLYAHVNMLYNLDFIHKWHKAGLGSNQIWMSLCFVMFCITSVIYVCLENRKSLSLCDWCPTHSAYHGECRLFKFILIIPFNDSFKMWQKLDFKKVKTQWIIIVLKIQLIYYMQKYDLYFEVFFLGCDADCIRALQSFLY